MRLSAFAGLVAALAVGGLVGWVGGLLLGLTASSVTVTVVARTLLVLAIVALVTRIVVARSPASDRLFAHVAGAGVLGYVLCPPSWTGRTLAGQLALDPGVGSALLDAAVWTAAVLLVARATDAAPRRLVRQPYA